MDNSERILLYIAQRLDCLTYALTAIKCTKESADSAMDDIETRFTELLSQIGSSSTHPLFPESPVQESTAGPVAVSTDKP